MQNFIQLGQTITGAAPYSITSGQGALIGKRFGIAADTYASGAPGQFVVNGVFDVAKDTSTFTDGATVYWDNTNHVATSLNGSAYIEIGTAAVLLPDGTAALGGASGDATVRVLLTPSAKPLITSADLDPTVQQVKTLVLSAANILAMNGTPVNVLPAPAANQVYIVDSVVAQLKPGATAFAGGGAVTLQYHGTAVNPHTGSITAAQVNAATAKTVYLGPNTSGALDLTTVPGLGLDITNATGAFTTGNGTIILTVYYSLITQG